jgi:hypothetical protein
MRTIIFTAITAIALGLSGCNDEGEVDICDDDIDCNDGFICEITDNDDGICIEGVTE